MTARPTQKIELRHYYHVYADGDYKDIVTEHFNALRTSGLLGALSHIHVGFVGSEENVRSAKQRVSRLTRSFSSNAAPSGWEQETQDFLYRDAREAKRPFLALYAHTKGASDRSEINEVWRKIMTRYTVRDWRNAVASVTGHVGAAGCFWAPFDNGRLVGEGEMPFFAGTFWWAKSEAIAEIGPPERVDRYDAERWIGKIIKLPQPYNIRCLYETLLELNNLQRAAREMGIAI